MTRIARAAQRPPTPLQFLEIADRRADPRMSAEVLGLEQAARLTAGVQVQVVNLSARGALLEQREWLRPGTRTELRLTRAGSGDEPAEQYSTAALVARCWVHVLSPLRYRTALVFAADLAVPGQGDEFDEVEVELVLQELTA